LAFFIAGAAVSLADNHSHTLEYSKWSGEVNVPDPVSITFDDQGTAYVTQTQRRKSQDLDIRQNRDWIPDDVALDSVEAKRLLFRSRLDAATSEANAERVADHNGDGVHDYRDLMVSSERIYRVTDRDSDGTADDIRLFAEGFNSEVTGIAAGVLWDRGDLYATIAPDVWRLKDSNGDGIADDREIISTGYGIHIAYAGHDMHGLIMGPDGKLYWSIGDKGINTRSKDGRRFYFPNQGGVMRCNPDGSDFEVFAHGLRNVQEFAFDAYGNWFGVDNDSDQKGESERFVHIVEGMDAGWRCNYQYRGDGYNPWMAEGLWKPWFQGQPAYIVPPISNYVDGPAGFVFNPGTALNPQYKDYFFVNSTLNGAQYAFQVEQAGASFRMINSHQIGAGIPLIGMTVGPDGALYSVDWGGGYPLNQRGAIWKIDDKSGADRKQREAVAQLLAEGLTTKGTREVRNLLGHEDQRIRLKAQFELVARTERETLTKESNGRERIKRIHAVWGLGQLARRGDSLAIEQLLYLLDDDDSEIQAQVIKALADLDPGSFNGEKLIPFLASSDPRVRFQAGLAVGNHGVEEAFGSVVEMIEANGVEDQYLRHSGIMALKGIGGAERLSSHRSEEARISAVVALRKTRSPAVVSFLKDSSPAVVREAALAIHDDLSIPEAMPALASLIGGDLDFGDLALANRVINANLRLGRLEDVDRVVALASRESVDSQLRNAALDALYAWVDTPVLDRVDGRARPLGPRSRQAVVDVVEPVLNSLLLTPDSVFLQKVVETASHLGVSLSQVALDDLLRNAEAPESLRSRALESLGTSEALEYALNARSSLLRATAASLLIAKDPQRATKVLAGILDNSELVQEKQNALMALASIDSPEAHSAIGQWAGKLDSASVPAPLLLDVIEAAKAAGFDDAIATFEANRPVGDPNGPYMESLEGGDPDAGEKVINTHLGGQCVRCHRFSSESGSKMGPDLKSIGSSKDRTYLLRSLIDPQADIAPGYGVVSITLKDGSTVSGIAGEEDSDSIDILSVDREDAQRIPKTNIVSRTEPISTMPAMGFVLTKRELRDVVAYLATLGGK
jgi:quinoprotein glucose dehydrogenase